MSPSGAVQRSWDRARDPPGLLSCPRSDLASPALARSVGRTALLSAVLCSERRRSKMGQGHRAAACPCCPAAVPGAASRVPSVCGNPRRCPLQSAGCHGGGDGSGGGGAGPCLLHRLRHATWACALPGYPVTGVMLHDVAEHFDRVLKGASILVKHKVNVSPDARDPCLHSTW